MPSLGAVLRTARKNKHFTLMDVKQRTGLSVSFLSDVERGVTNPSIDTLEKLAKCYEVNMGELLGFVNFDTSASPRSLPPKFEDFESYLKRQGIDLSDDMRELLLQVQYRSSIKKEPTIDDWLRRYYLLKGEIE